MNINSFYEESSAPMKVELNPSAMNKYLSLNVCSLECQLDLHIQNLLNYAQRNNNTSNQNLPPKNFNSRTTIHASDVFISEEYCEEMANFLEDFALENSTLEYFTCQTDSFYYPSLHLINSNYRAVIVLRIFRTQILLRLLKIINSSLRCDKNSNLSDNDNQETVPFYNPTVGVKQLKSEIEKYIYKCQQLSKAQFKRISPKIRKEFTSPRRVNPFDDSKTVDIIKLTVNKLILDVCTFLEFNDTHDWSINLLNCQVFNVLNDDFLALFSTWLVEFCKDFENYSTFPLIKPPILTHEDFELLLLRCEKNYKHNILPITWYDLMKFKYIVADNQKHSSKLLTSNLIPSFSLLLRLSHLLFWLPHDPYYTKVYRDHLDWSDTVKKVGFDLNELILNSFPGCQTIYWDSLLLDKHWNFFVFDLIISCLSIAFTLLRPELTQKEERWTCKDKSSMITPFIILFYYLEMSSEFKEIIVKMQDTTFLNSCNILDCLPMPLKYLDICHELFGSYSICTTPTDDGRFLKLFVTKFYQEAQTIADAISSVEKNGCATYTTPSQQNMEQQSIIIPNLPPSQQIKLGNKLAINNNPFRTALQKLEEYNQEIGIKIEQAYYCLFDFTQRKWKNSKYLIDHGTPKVKFELEDGPMLFNFLKPSDLPTFHSKTNTINTEIKDLLEYMLRFYHDKHLNTSSDENIKQLQRYLDNGEIFTIDDEVCYNDINFLNSPSPYQQQTILNSLKRHIDFILYGNVGVSATTSQITREKDPSKREVLPAEIRDNGNLNDLMIIGEILPHLSSKEMAIIDDIMLQQTTDGSVNHSVSPAASSEESAKAVKASNSTLKIQINSEQHQEPALTSFEQTVLREIYYLLGDYYFKNMYTCKSLRFYLMDVCYNECCLVDTLNSSTSTFDELSKDRFDTWAGIALVRSSSFEQLLRTVKVDFETFPASSRHKGTLACFDKALRLYETSVVEKRTDDLKNNHGQSDGTEDVENNLAVTSLWVEKGALAFMLASTASRKLKRCYLYQVTDIDKRDLKSFRSDMLNVSKICYEAAQKLAKTNEEKWLYSYMLGKIDEKLDPQNPEYYLEKYRISLNYLHEEGCTYPRKINFHNPQHFAIEACEVFYRIHASILKYVEKCFDNVYVLTLKTMRVFQKYLNFAWESPFVTAIFDIKNDVDDITSINEISYQEIKEIRKKSVRGLKVCMNRLPQHYKSFYRLVYHYYKYGSTPQDHSFAKSLFTGLSTEIYFDLFSHSREFKDDDVLQASLKNREDSTEKTIIFKINSLFGERKKMGGGSILFGTIWRLPVEECDRPGNFSYHVFQIAQLFCELCKVTKDTENLKRLIQQTKKAPEKDRKYIYEAERKYLYGKATCYLNEMCELIPQDR